MNPLSCPKLQWMMSCYTPSFSSAQPACNEVATVIKRNTASFFVNFVLLTNQFTGAWTRYTGTLQGTPTVNTYTTSPLRDNYLCIFLLNTVDKLAFYMYVFLIYVCLQKHCLRLICLSSIAHTYSIDISDVNLIGPSYRVNQLGSASISSSQILTLLVSRARYPVREFHDVTRVARD